MKDKCYQLRLDAETRVALSRLANADERTAAAQVRWMIRTEAIKRGLWSPTPLRAVDKQSKP